MSCTDLYVVKCCIWLLVRFDLHWVQRDIYHFNPTDDQYILTLFVNQVPRMPAQHIAEKQTVEYPKTVSSGSDSIFEK